MLSFDAIHSELLRKRRYIKRKEINRLCMQAKYRHKGNFNFAQKAVLAEL
jgi:hypothetical protein